MPWFDSAPKATIHAIPEPKVIWPALDLYHEAAVGKIAEEEVEYLWRAVSPGKKPPLRLSVVFSGWISTACADAQ